VTGRVRLAAAALLALAACAPGPASAPAERGRPGPDYLGVETRLLDDDLVNLIVAVEGAGAGAAAERAVQDYAPCAAGGYALIRGFGFARHVRTTATEEAGLWVADAVYTVSPALPRGVATLDAEVVTADCAEQGIPTV